MLLQDSTSDSNLSELIAMRDADSPINNSDYADLVNIDEIASVDGSIGNYIDWDQIDELIYEFNYSE